MAKQSAGGHLVVRRARAGQKVAVIENVTIWEESTWEAYADHGDEYHIVTGKEKYVADTINLNDYYLWQGKATDTNNYYSVYALIWKIETTTDNQKKLYLRTKYYTVAKKGDTGDDALQYIIECSNETPNITNGAVRVTFTAYTQLGKQQRQQATLEAGKLWWDVNQTSNITNPLEVSVNSEMTVKLRTTDGIVATKHVAPVKDGSPGIQGIQGCIVRVSEWVVGVEYHNDEALTSGTRYLDVAVVTTGANTFKAYKCRVTHTATADNAPVAGTTTTQWEPFNSMAPIYTPLIMAAHAILRLAQTNQIVVTNSDNKVVAGMQGDPSKRIFWIENPTTGASIEIGLDATTGAPYIIGHNQDTEQANGSDYAVKIDPSTGLFDLLFSNKVRLKVSRKGLYFSNGLSDTFYIDNEEGMTFNGQFVDFGTAFAGIRLNKDNIELGSYSGNTWIGQKLYVDINGFLKVEDSQ